MRGTVAAASDWDSPMEVKAVRPSLPDSYERLCHDSGVAALPPRPARRRGTDEAASRRFSSRGWSASSGSSTGRRPSAGAIIAEAVLPNQFDAWVWFDETEAVTPLPGAEEAPAGEDGTYPFGL